MLSIMLRGTRKCTHRRLPLKRRHRSARPPNNPRLYPTESRSLRGAWSCSDFGKSLNSPVRTGFPKAGRATGTVTSLRRIGAYNFEVARGWESKSVEAQQAEAGQDSSKPRVRITADEAARRRTKEGLLLSRKRVTQQLEGTLEQRHRQMLVEALAELERKLRELEG